MRNTAIMPLFAVGRAGQKIKDISTDGLYEIFSQVIYDLPKGEQLQKKFKKRVLGEKEEEFDVGSILDEYLRKTYYKTGSLFSGLIRGSALILGMDKAQEQSVFQMGVHIGTSFQISDDLLDLLQSPLIQNAGGELGSDVEKDKLNDLEEMNITAPYLLSYFEVEPEEKGRYLAALRKRERQREDIDIIVREFLKGTAENRCWNLAVYQLNQGLLKLSQFSEEDSEGYFALKKFGEKMVLRNR